MKDATGELSMTAIAVVAIAAIGVVFTTLIWPNIKGTITRNTYCSQAYNCKEGEGNLLTCSYIEDKGVEQVDKVKCTKQDSAKID